MCLEPVPLKKYLTYTLRDYQQVIVKKLHEAIEQGETQILLQLAGGAGKTKTLLSLMSILAEEGVNSIFTTPRINLAKQTHSEAPMALGYMQGHKSLNLESNTIIANIDTLIKREKTKTDVVIFDEVHMKTNLLGRFQNYKVRIGISATPYDGKGNPLQGWEDAFIIEHHFDERWLVSKKYLTPMVYFDASETLDTLDVAISDDDSISSKNKEIVENTIVNLVDSLEEKAGKKYFHESYSLVVAQSISHADEITEDFRTKGYRVGVYHSNEKKTDALKDIKNKEINIIVAVDKVSVGSDISHLDNVILAKVFASHSLYRQTVLRGTRLYEGKSYFYVYDFGSNRKRLGNPMIAPEPPKEKKKKDRKGFMCEACEEPLVRILYDEKIDTKQMVRVKYFRCSNCGDKSVKLEDIAHVKCKTTACDGIVLVDSLAREDDVVVGYCSESKHRNVLSLVNSTLLTLKVTDTRKGIIRRLGDMSSLNESLVNFVLYSTTEQIAFLEEIYINSFGKYSSEFISKTLLKAKRYGEKMRSEKSNMKLHHLLLYVVDTEMLEEVVYSSLIEVLEEEMIRVAFLEKFKNRGQITPRKIKNFINKVS